MNYQFYKASRAQTSPNQFKKLCVSGASMMSLAAFLVAGQAVAQTSTDAGGMQEVVVTARKRAENLQDVPLAITALTASTLEAAGVQDLRDITFLTPGLTFTTGAGANYFSKPIIRGQVDIGGSGDNNVPVFFDGIYVSNTSAIDFGLVDIARVEVIKGPVSATYGRSAYAGAINYVSTKPTDEYRGEIEATGGDYGKYAFSGRISGPIWGDVLKGGISASYDHFDGTYHDDVTHQNAGGYEKKDVLVNLDYTPNEHIEIRPVVYYGDDTFGSAPVTFGPANCSVGLGYGYSQSFCGKVPNSTFVGPFVAAPGNYGQTGNSRKVFTSSLHADFKYDWGTVSSLTGFDSFLTNQYSEFDDQDFGTLTPYYALPAGAVIGGFPTTPAQLATFGATPVGSVDTPLHFGYTDKNHDFSQELRFSSPQNEPARFSVGAYYASSYHYEDLNLARGTCSVPAGDYIVSYFSTPCGVSKSPQQTLYTEKNTIGAGFISFDWDFWKKFTLSTEARDSSTKAEYRDIFAIFTPFPNEGYSTSGASTVNPIGPNTLSKTFWSVTSRTSLTYKFTRDINVYASIANGEKIGGFNNNTTYPTFNPETNWTYEAGVKSTLLDRHLQLDGDVFYIDASNYQIYGPPPGATLPGSFITTNYGGLSTVGVELSGSYIVNEWAKLSAAFAYADPEFKHDAYDFGDVTLCSGIASCAPRIVTVGPNKAVSLNGLRPPYESNYTFNTALDLHYPVFNGWLATGRLDYRFESSQYYQYPIDTGYFGPKNIVNLRIGLEHGPYSITAYVRNLTNDKTPETVQDAAVTGAPFTSFQSGYFPVAVLPDQRNFGVTLRYKFGS